MSRNFEFNAPQFLNFVDMDDPQADSFFDVNLQEEQQKIIKFPREKIIKKGEAPFSKEADLENKDPIRIKSGDPANCQENIPVLRKVLNEIVNQQIQNNNDNPLQAETHQNLKEKDIEQQFQKLYIQEPKITKTKVPLRATQVFNNPKSEQKSHQMITRLDAKSQTSENESIPRQSENSSTSENYISATSEASVGSLTITSKSSSLKRNASPIHSSRKFMTLAEQVEHFHKDTPERYRTKPKNSNTPRQNSWVGKVNYVPKTPKLSAKFRHRKVDYPNEQQREEMELEEIKKHQIKANPLNEKILVGVALNLKAPIIKKPTTIPQPFSLTEVKKKDIPPEPVFEFKAQPIPTGILRGPVGIPPKKVSTPTVPTTPRIRVPMRLRVEVKTPDKSICSDTLNPPRNTKVEPFSFDARMKELLQRKEDHVKKILEEEKKNFNSFKAKPMPIFRNKNEESLKIEKTPHKTEHTPSSVIRPKVNKSFSELQDLNALKVTPFKARPATVVYQKPFVPKMQRHDLLLPVDFHLNTEKRAVERQKFDAKIKEKEDELALILKLQKEEEERLENEKMLEERKKLEFKAKPMPRFKAFEIHASDPQKLTYPRSPMFSSKLKEARKMNH